MSKHTNSLASDGWTLIYRDAKSAAWAHEAIRQGADEDCTGPGEEGWYWYNEGTGQVGDRINLDLLAAAPRLLHAAANLLAYLPESSDDFQNKLEAALVAAIAKAEGRS